MDYIELPPAPKGILDKMISNDALRVQFSANGSGAGGCRVPAFSHTKPLPSMAIASAPPSGGGSGAELSRRGGGIPSFVAGGPPLNGTHMPLANGGSSSLGGVGHLQIAGDSGSSQQGDEVMEKGKRSRGGEGGGRGSSRGGGTSSRKRTRAAAPADSSLTTSEFLPDGSVSGGAAGSGGRAPTGNGVRQSEILNGDKPEKSNGKRQCGQSAKRGDKKQSQMVAGSAVNDVLPQKAVEANGVVANGLGTGPGLLDVYGLRTRTTDVRRFMVDIPLGELLSGEFEAPTFSMRDNRETKEEVEESLGRQIERALNLFPKPLPGTTTGGSVPSSRTGELSGNSGAKGLKREKVILDLERPLSLEDDDVASKVGKSDKEMQPDFASATSLEAVDRISTRDVQADGMPLAHPSWRFSIDSLPLHPVQSFLDRLNLTPSEPLQSLISQAGGADGEMSGGFGEVVESCHRNCSVPPFSFSNPHSGPVKADSGRYYNPFVWDRNPPAETSGGGKGGSRLSGGKGGSSGVAEEDGSSSPSSRRKLSDGKDPPVQAADASHLMSTSTATQSLAPSQQAGHQSLPGAVAGSVNPATATFQNEEPRRQEESDIGGTSSGEGALKPMQIDSGGNGEGGFLPPAPIVLEGTNSPPAIPPGNDLRHQRSGGGEAVRPLETKTNLVGGPKEMDSSSHYRLGKPEKAEQQQQATPAKDFSGEEVNREPTANLAPGTSKLELVVVQPALDAEGNVVRSSPPPHIDSSLGLLGFPSLRDADEVTAAAYTLCTMAKSTNNADQDKITRLKENSKRRVFQPYPGAPAQKAAKSIRVSGSSAIGSGDAGGGREARRSSDAGGGSVPPSSSRGLSSERRKSLSQVNDAAASEKPSFPSPRHSGGGVSTGPRGANTHTGSRSNSFSLKLEKNATTTTTTTTTTTGREQPAKETTTNGKELAGRGSSSLPPPVSHGSGSSLKNGHKGVKTNTSSYLHSGSNSKGAAVTTATAAASFPKGPAACTTQRVGSGGTSSRGSRTVHTGNSLVSHGAAAAPAGPFKSSSRQSIPEINNRQKTKSDLSGRGSKPNRE